MIAKMFGDKRDAILKKIDDDEETDAIQPDWAEIWRKQLTKYSDEENLNALNWESGE